MSAQIDEPLIFNPGDQFRQFHYVVDRFLGAGASGQVYAVHHRYTGVPFALKVSHVADQRDIKKVVRNLTDAQASYCIRHANVVEVVDIGCEDDGMVWQIMELLDGHPVGELLRRCGALSPIYAIDVAVETAWGLSAAHEIGVVHRDVQPSNVFVTERGRVKVLDFSLASWVRSPLKTTAGRPPKGTLGYMAPEHIRKAVPSPHFDVYALGILLWEMLVGRHPFQEDVGVAGRLVLRQLNDMPEPLVTAAGLPAYVDEVVRQAIAKDPRERYETMWAFARDLLALRERLLADETAPARVRYGEEWERRAPIARGAEIPAQYRSPRPIPVEEAPPLPSARVYVPREPAALAPAKTVPLAAVESPAPEKARVAATVPMAAVPGPRPPDPQPVPETRVNRTPMAVAAPVTVRRAPATRRTGWIGAAIGVPVLLGIGAAVWVLRGSSDPAPGAPPPAAPSPSSMAPAPAASGSAAESRRAPAPSADPRRNAPPRTRR